MDCRAARETMGAHLDGELAAGEISELEAHLGTCTACAGEYQQQRRLVDLLNAGRSGDDIEAPQILWSGIEQQMDSARGIRSWHRFSRLFHRPLAMAASVAILIGGGVLVGLLLTAGEQTAQATVVDYSVLMDGIAADTEKAVRRFCDYYGGQPIAAEEAATAAPGLRFAIPPELPGGFVRERVYRLRFGASPGVAACYRRGQEPLVVFFHPPIGQRRLGVHRESECHVAGREGHRIDVEPWHLIHFTDPTTCHCLLSRLDQESDVYAVMAAIAPDFSSYIPDTAEPKPRSGRKRTH